MSYLSYFLYIFVLVHTEDLYRHWFFIVDAFPNIAKTPRSDGILSCLDKFPRNDVGGR